MQNGFPIFDLVFAREINFLRLLKIQPEHKPWA